MSKNLARLLDQPERLVTGAIAGLEAANGYPSHDVSVLATNSQAVRLRLADLKLDPDDTTSEELYHALLAKFERDSSLVDKAVGIDGRSSFRAKAERAVSLINAMSLKTDNMWALKHGVLRKALHEQPPKKLMKLLGYRSVDSMLKRENIAAVSLALASNESASWQKNFTRGLAKLSSTDYQLARPEFIHLSAKNWSKADAPTGGVNYNVLTASVGLWPTRDNLKSPALTLALLMLDGLEGLTHSETYLSIAQLNPALVWWEQSKNLIANCDGDIVSLNYKDVAVNHSLGNSFADRVSRHAQHSLWNELASRYENESQQLETVWEGLESEAVEGINNIAATVPVPAKLAAEYSEI